MLPLTHLSRVRSTAPCSWPVCGSGLNQLTIQLSDGEYFLLLGSYGALMALQFGAPNSPLAQPRNAIGGQPGWKESAARW